MSLVAGETQQLRGQLGSRGSEARPTGQGYTQSIQIDVLPLAGAKNRFPREELALEQPGGKPTHHEGNHLSNGKLQKIIYSATWDQPLLRQNQFKNRKSKQLFWKLAWLCSLGSLQAEAELVILVQLLFSLKHLPSVPSQSLASHLLGYSGRLE